MNDQQQSQEIAVQEISLDELRDMFQPSEEGQSTLAITTDGHVTIDRGSAEIQSTSLRKRRAWYSQR